MDGEVIKGGVGDVSLSYNAEGWRRVETSSGYMIEFEAGGTLRYVTLDGTGAADVDLTAGNVDGAVGDVRDNVLSAQDHIASVQISGGAGNDLVKREPAHHDR